MELCVFIPEEFCLTTSDKTYFVSSRRKIEKDTKFNCLEGDFRLAKVGSKKQN